MESNTPKSGISTKKRVQKKVSKCHVKGCQSRSSNISGLSYHCFPKKYRLYETKLDTSETINVDYPDRPHNTKFPELSTAWSSIIFRESNVTFAYLYTSFSIIVFILKSTFFHNFQLLRTFVWVYSKLRGRCYLKTAILLLLTAPPSVFPIPNRRAMESWFHSESLSTMIMTMLSGERRSGEFGGFPMWPTRSSKLKIMKNSK